MAKYVHEFHVGCKCDLRISILPQLFYPKFTVVCGSGDAVALGWVSFSMVVTEKAHSSKSYFVCPVWPIPVTAQHTYCLKWTGVSGMGCWLGSGAGGQAKGAQRPDARALQGNWLYSQEVGSVSLDSSEFPLVCLLNILNFNFWVVTLATVVTAGGCHVDTVAGLK